MISVILSTNNEIRNGYLKKILTSIENQDTEHEIIVVDNGSTDDTIKLCKKYADKIFTLPNSNRAQRFNYWMKKAKWKIILFHHPVTLMQDDAFEYIENFIKTWSIWGGFTHSFDHRHWLLAFTSWYSNNVRGKRGILYADHLIFWKKKCFESVGGFPDMDVVEETPLCAAMRKKYWKPEIIPHKVVTSARRFTGRGMYKHALLNQYIKLWFYLWLSDKIMNKHYEKREGYNVKYK